MGRKLIAAFGSEKEVRIKQFSEKASSLILELSQETDWAITELLDGFTHTKSEQTIDSIFTDWYDTPDDTLFESVLYCLFNGEVDRSVSRLIAAFGCDDNLRLVAFSEEATKQMVNLSTDMEDGVFQLLATFVNQNEIPIAMTYTDWLGTDDDAMEKAIRYYFEQL